jgi:VWFA-related protein
MVLRQTGRLTAEASFGSPAERIDAVLARLAKPPAEIASPDEKRRLITRVWNLWEESRQRAPFGTDPCQFFVRPTLDEIEAFAREAAIASQYTLHQLADVADFLGGVPGGKTLVYLGDALELTPGTDLLEIVHGLCPQALPGPPAPTATEDLTRLFERAAAAANAGRVTIHTLQVGGLSPGLIGGPEQRASDPRLAATFERALRTSERGGLEVLAVRTGGRAIRDTNSFDDALERIAADLGTYYSLGFSPGEGFDAGMHRIEIRARRPGLGVRHRREFHLKTPSERLDELALRAIYLGVAPEAFDLRLAHGEIRSVSGDRFLLPIHVLVPVDRIAYREQGDGPPMASLEVVVHGRSPDQPEAPAVRRTFRFARPEAATGRAELVVEIPLRPGLHVIGVGVRDQVSGEVAAVATTLGVQPPPAAGAGGSR